MTEAALTPCDEAEAMQWQPARAAGLERLAEFMPRAGRAYAARRNYDFGPQDRSNVSALSPWIRHRLILEPEVLAETLRRHRFSAAEKFLQEVFWRTYFKGWLEQRPQVWTRYRSDLDSLIRALETDAALDARYREAVEGRTGIDCFDAWARELVESGYLHNHTRMWMASIWIFTLALPWQLGADFFYRHLLDGDPASNTLSWRWVGGLHTKGKTYLARASNIERYTEGRFNPAGHLAPHAPPLQEEDAGPVWPLAAPDAMPADQSFGLLITEEDGAPENLVLPGRPVSALGLVATEARSPLPVGLHAAGFAAGAVDDALSRAGQHYEIDTGRAEAAAWQQSLADWAEREGFRTIVTAHAPVGPVAERLHAAGPELERSGIRLVRVRREYDSLSWPRATKGFFGLKSHIPGILAQLGLTG